MVNDAKVGAPEKPLVVPTSQLEFIQLLNETKKILVPTRSNRLEVTPISYASERGVEPETGRVFDGRVVSIERGSFWLLFSNAEESEIAPARLPILVVPGLDLTKAWWKLPE